MYMPFYTTSGGEERGVTLDMYVKLHLYQVSNPVPTGVTLEDASGSSANVPPATTSLLHHLTSVMPSTMAESRRLVYQTLWKKGSFKQVYGAPHLLGANQFRGQLLLSDPEYVYALPLVTMDTNTACRYDLRCVALLSMFPYRLGEQSIDAMAITDAEWDRMLNDMEAKYFTSETLYASRYSLWTYRGPQGGVRFVDPVGLAYDRDVVAGRLADAGLDLNLPIVMHVPDALNNGPALVGALPVNPGTSERNIYWINGGVVVQNALPGAAAPPSQVELEDDKASYVVENVYSDADGLLSYNYNVTYFDGGGVRHTAYQTSYVRWSTFEVDNVLDGNFSVIANHASSYGKLKAEDVVTVSSESLPTFTDPDFRLEVRTDLRHEFDTVEGRVVFALEDVIDHGLIHVDTQRTVNTVISDAIRVQEDEIRDVISAVSLNTATGAQLQRVRSIADGRRMDPYRIVNNNGGDGDFKMLISTSLSKAFIDNRCPKIRGFLQNEDRDACHMREMHSAFGVGHVTSDIS